MPAVEAPYKDFSAELTKIDILPNKTINDYFGLAKEISNTRKLGYKPVVYTINEEKKGN